MYGINIGCLEGVSEKEVSEIPITYIDGLHDKWASGPEFLEALMTAAGEATGMR